MNIQKDMQDLIAKNMPAAVGEELQKLLAQGAKDATDLASARADAKFQKDASLSATAKIADLHSQLLRHAEIDKREAAVTGREQAIEVRELKQELAAEKRISTFASNTVDRLVRNVEFRKSVFTTDSVPVAIQTGSGGYVTTTVQNQQSNKSHSENSTEE